jgi:membrane-associated phospholipid phosphatase
MRRRRAPTVDAPLPARAWPDAIRQVLLFGGAYLLYQLVRGLVNGNDAARATWNATRIIDLERRLHLFVEPSVQAWTLHRPWLMDMAGWTYLDAHGAVTFGALTFVYLRRNESFAFMRNMFVLAMGIALVGYAVYPTAPPRLMPQWGFTDPIRLLTGIDAERGPGSILLNPYAAIPSMHVCFALLTAGSMSPLARRRAIRVLWWLYPPVISLVVLATGNHYLIDIALGALTAAAAALLARALPARAGSDVWARVAPDRPAVP